MDPYSDETEFPTLNFDSVYHSPNKRNQRLLSNGNISIDFNGVPSRTEDASSFASYISSKHSSFNDNRTRTSTHCGECEYYKKEMERMDIDHRTNFQFLKKRIIGTDTVIERNKIRQYQNDAQLKIIEALKIERDQANKDSTILSEQLKVAVDSLKPLEEDKNHLTSLLKIKDTRIQDLLTQISADKAYRTQKNAWDDRNKKIDQEIQVLERKNKTLSSKSEELQTKLAQLERENRDLDDQCNYQRRKLQEIAASLIKAESEVKQLWGKCKSNGLVKGRVPRFSKGFKSLIKQAKDEERLKKASSATSTVQADEGQDYVSDSSTVYDPDSDTVYDLYTSHNEEEQFNLVPENSLPNSQDLEIQHNEGNEKCPNPVLPNKSMSPSPVPLNCAGDAVSNSSVKLNRSPVRSIVPLKDDRKYPLRNRKDKKAKIDSGEDGQRNNVKHKKSLARKNVSKTKSNHKSATDVDTSDLGFTSSEEEDNDENILKTNTLNNPKTVMPNVTKFKKVTNNNKKKNSLSTSDTDGFENDFVSITTETDNIDYLPKTAANESTNAEQNDNIKMEDIDIRVHPSNLFALNNDMNEEEEEEDSEDDKLDKVEESSAGFSPISLSSVFRFASIDLALSPLAQSPRPQSVYGSMNGSASPMPHDAIGAISPVLNTEEENSCEFVNTPAFLLPKECPESDLIPAETSIFPESNKYSGQSLSDINGDVSEDSERKRKVPKKYLINFLKSKETLMPLNTNTLNHSSGQNCTELLRSPASSELKEPQSDVSTKSFSIKPFSIACKNKLKKKEAVLPVVESMLTNDEETTEKEDLPQANGQSGPLTFTDFPPRLSAAPVPKRPSLSSPTNQKLSQTSSTQQKLSLSSPISLKPDDCRPLLSLPGTECVKSLPGDMDSAMVTFLSENDISPNLGSHFMSVRKRRLSDDSGSVCSDAIAVPEYKKHCGSETENVTDDKRTISCVELQHSKELVLSEDSGLSAHTTGLVKDCVKENISVGKTLLNNCESDMELDSNNEKESVICMFDNSQSRQSIVCSESMSTLHTSDNCYNTLSTEPQHCDNFTSTLPTTHNSDIDSSNTSPTTHYNQINNSNTSITTHHPDMKTSSPRSAQDSGLESRTSSQTSHYQHDSDCNMSHSSKNQADSNKSPSIECNPDPNPSISPTTQRPSPVTHLQPDLDSEVASLTYTQNDTSNSLPSALHTTECMSLVDIFSEFCIPRLITPPVTPLPPPSLSAPVECKRGPGRPSKSYAQPKRITRSNSSEHEPLANNLSVEATPGSGEKDSMEIRLPSSQSAVIVACSIPQTHVSHLTSESPVSATTTPSATTSQHTLISSKSEMEVVKQIPTKRKRGRPRKEKLIKSVEFVEDSDELKQDGEKTDVENVTNGCNQSLDEQYSNAQPGVKGKTGRQTKHEQSYSVHAVKIEPKKPVGFRLDKETLVALGSPPLRLPTIQTKGTQENNSTPDMKNGLDASGFGSDMQSNVCGNEDSLSTATTSAVTSTTSTIAPHHGDPCTSTSNSTHQLSDTDSNKIYPHESHGKQPQQENVNSVQGGKLVLDSPSSQSQGEPGAVFKPSSDDKQQEVQVKKKKKRKNKNDTKKEDKLEPGEMKSETFSIKNPAHRSIWKYLDEHLRSCVPDNAQTITKMISALPFEAGNMIQLWPILIEAVDRYLRFKLNKVDDQLISICQQNKIDFLLNGLFASYEEKLICDLLLHCLQEFKFLDLSVLFSRVWNSIFSQEDIPQHGRSSLCRFFTLMCRKQGDLDQVRLLVYNVVWCGYLTRLEHLILSAVGVWPAVLSSIADTDSCVLRVLRWILLERSYLQKRDNQVYNALFKVCQWDMRQWNGHKDYEGSKLLDSLLKQASVATTEDGALEISKAIELLAIYKGTDWTKRYLIREMALIAEAWQVQFTIKDEEKKSLKEKDLHTPYIILLCKIFRRIIAAQPMAPDTVYECVENIFGKFLSMNSGFLDVEMELAETLLQLVPLCKKVGMDILKAWHKEVGNKNKKSAEIISKAKIIIKEHESK